MPKRYLHGPVTWKVTRRNAWKDIANLRIEQLSKFQKTQRHAWMTIILKEEENWICWRIVNCLLTNCSEMSVFSSYRQARYFMVCEQTCSCGHKMDESL